MVLTFPHLGNAYITAKILLDELDLDYIIPPFNNKKALEIGTKYAPEMSCLPLKLTIGNYIQAREQGADTILITGGQGPCRFGYYCEMQREILRDAGYEMDVIALEMPDRDFGEFLRRIRKLTGGLNVYKIIKAAKRATRMSILVDELERVTFRLRPREIKRGSVDRIYSSFRKKALITKGYHDMKRLVEDTQQKLLTVEIDNSLKPLKVGIVGEIYTTIESYSSFNLQEKLGSMGVEVARPVTVSGWVVDHMLKTAFHLPRDERYKEVAKPYIGTVIGGHAQETVGNTILFAKDGYDGVIQIYPLTCMPEIVAESILPAVERDFNIPVLTLIIDEMTGEAGYMTRVEAFIDLMNKRRERAGNENECVLSGN